MCSRRAYVVRVRVGDITMTHLASHTNHKNTKLDATRRCVFRFRRIPPKRRMLCVICGSFEILQFGRIVVNCCSESCQRNCRQPFETTISKDYSTASIQLRAALQNCWACECLFTCVLLLLLSRWTLSENVCFSVLAIPIVRLFSMRWIIPWHDRLRQPLDVAFVRLHLHSILKSNAHTHLDDSCWLFGIPMNLR